MNPITYLAIYLPVKIQRVYICISIFQNEKNQIMKSNVWLRLVSYFVYIKRKFNSHRYGLWSTEYLFKIFLEINNIHHFLGME